MAQPAWADGGKPEFRADISVEIEDDYAFRSSDPDEEFNDAYATIESELALVSDSGTGLYAKATLEPVVDSSDNRFLEGYGLYLEEFYAGFRVDEATMRVGKLSPAFGLANDIAPGPFGDELAGQYELTEEIGLAVEIPITSAVGEHTLQAAAFVADTTPLSDSLFTSRGRLRRTDGGMANTDWPPSVALSLFGEIKGTAYTLGLRRQSAGAGDSATEFGGVLALARSVDAGSNTFTFLGELAHFPNYDGDEESASFLTLGVELTFEDFSLSSVVGRQDFEGSRADDFLTLALEYDLRDNLSLGVGYRFLSEEDESTHTIGLLLTYEFRLH